MTMDMKPESAPFRIDQPSATPLLAVTTTKPHLLKSRAALALGVGSICLIFGLLINGGDTQTMPAAVPVTTVAKIGTAPAACIEALDLADQAFGLAGDGFTVVSQSYTALAQGDFAGAAVYATELTGITDQITVLTPDYQAAKASCQGS
jgi:hypothetical protein